MPIDNNSTNTIGAYLVEQFTADSEDHLARALTAYVATHETDRWLMFSDYVLGQSGRPTDVLAFTVVPGGDYLNSVTATFKRTARRDFKDVKEVGPAMLQLLSDPRLFSVCFLLPRSRALFGAKQTVQTVLEPQIAHAMSVADVAGDQASLQRYRNLRQRSAANGFSVRLFENIIISASCASFVTVQICKVRRASRFGWFSDRDAITTSHDGLAYTMYESYTRQVCQHIFGGWPGPALGMNAEPAPGDRPWSDIFNRVPDYFAGMLAAWNLDTDEIPEAPLKYQQVLRTGIAGHANVNVIRLHFSIENANLVVRAQPLTIRPRAAPATQAEV